MSVTRPDCPCPFYMVFIIVRTCILQPPNLIKPGFPVPGAGHLRYIFWIKKKMFPVINATIEIPENSVCPPDQSCFARLFANNAGPVCGLDIVRPDICSEQA